MLQIMKILAEREQALASADLQKSTFARKHVFFFFFLLEQQQTKILQLTQKLIMAKIVY